MSLRFSDQGATESLTDYTARIYGPCTCGDTWTCSGCAWLVDLERLDAARPKVIA